MKFSRRKLGASRWQFPVVVVVVVVVMRSRQGCGGGGWYGKHKRLGGGECVCVCENGVSSWEIAKVQKLISGGGGWSIWASVLRL